jgi:hypothetical protein
MKGSYVDAARPAGRCLNAVALRNAVLCAECDVVSDSPHDRCLVCGSPSLVNLARMLGGNLPRDRADCFRNTEKDDTEGGPALSKTSSTSRESGGLNHFPTP